MKNKCVQVTFENKKLNLHFVSVVGSKLHKLDTETSDTDYKCVYTWDKEAFFMYESLPDTLDKNMFSEERMYLWENLVKEVAKELDLPLEDCDDMSFFEVKKWVDTCVKSDLNMFDMLSAKDEYVLLETLEFKELRDNQVYFLDLSNSYSRFRGLASNVMRRFLKNRDSVRDKDLSKVFLSLYALKNLLLKGFYNPVLPEEERDFVMRVKLGQVDKDSLEPMYNKLFKEVETLNVPETQYSLEKVKELVFNVYKTNQ